MKLRPPKLLQPIQIVRIANSLLIRVRGVIVLTSISVSYRSLASQDYLALSGPEFLKYRFPSSTLLVLLPRDLGRVLLVFLRRHARLEERDSFQFPQPGGVRLLGRQCTKIC